jgi:hypothetical protein
MILEGRNFFADFGVNSIQPSSPLLVRRLVIRVFS